MNYATDNEMAEAHNNLPDWTPREFKEAVDECVDNLAADDESLEMAVSDLLCGLIRREELHNKASVGILITDERKREDLRARGALQAIRDLPKDSPLRALVWAELETRAERLVELGQHRVAA